MTNKMTVVLLAACALAFAHEHIALNGTWTLVPGKCDFAGQPAMLTGSVTINERQGNVTVSRSFSYQGAGETLFYRDMSDSENGATIHDGKNYKTKAHWDHDVLKVTTTQSSAVTVETYSLSANGTMTVNVARPGRQLVTLIFERQ
jgi:hypothetical protein